MFENLLRTCPTTWANALIRVKSVKALAVHTRVWVALVDVDLTVFTKKSSITNAWPFNTLTSIGTTYSLTWIKHNLSWNEKFCSKSSEVLRTIRDKMNSNHPIERDCPIQQRATIGTITRTIQIATIWFIFRDILKNFFDRFDTLVNKLLHYRGRRFNFTHSSGKIKRPPL